MPPSCALLGVFAIGAWVALLRQHYGNAWQSPAVIHQAHRTPHACRTRTLRMPAKTPLAGDKIDAPAACAVPFRLYCGGVVTRTRNVSVYMLVLAVCLVLIFLSLLSAITMQLLLCPANCIPPETFDESSGTEHVKNNHVSADRLVHKNISYSYNTVAA